MLRGGETPEKGSHYGTISNNAVKEKIKAENMKIAVLTSGGVDSSVALRLLKDAGYSVTAFYLKIWLEDELAFLGECPWEEDLKFARAVAGGAGVPP